MKALCELFTRLMPVWVVLMGVLGYAYPPVFALFKPYLNWMFFLTMAGIGAVLNFDDFVPILKNPRTVFLGMAAQFVIMPGLGFTIGWALDLSAPLRLGLVLVGCVPGAMASNVIAYLARTDVAYSISLTSTATLLSPVITPLLTYVFARTAVPVPVAGMLTTILTIVIAPLGLGFLLRRFFERQIMRIQFVFPAFSTFCIAMICALVVSLNRDMFLELSGLIFLAVFLMNLGGLVLGYGAGGLFRFDDRRKKTLAVEVGMQNAGLGAVLALNHFSELTALVPAIFATWCVITASVLAEVWALRQGKAAESS